RVLLVAAGRLGEDRHRLLDQVALQAEDLLLALVEVGLPLIEVVEGLVELGPDQGVVEGLLLLLLLVVAGVLVFGGLGLDLLGDLVELVAGLGEGGAGLVGAGLLGGGGVLAEGAGQLGL